MKDIDFNNIEMTEQQMLKLYYYLYDGEKNDSILKDKSTKCKFH
jgi:hypothetical protein